MDSRCGFLPRLLSVFEHLAPLLGIYQVSQRPMSPTSLVRKILYKKYIVALSFIYKLHDSIENTVAYPLLKGSVYGLFFATAVKKAELQKVSLSNVKWQMPVLLMSLAVVCFKTLFNFKRKSKNQVSVSSLCTVIK